MFGYSPELKEKYENYNITKNEISDTALKNLAKVIIQTVAKYDD